VEIVTRETILLLLDDDDVMYEVHVQNCHDLIAFRSLYIWRGNLD